MNDSIRGSLLGRETGYTDRYAPERLYPVPRQEARRELGLGTALPFGGVDFWHGYELSWLNARGRPCVAMARFSFPCDSPNIIESKSFKLYLNSFANSRFAGMEQVAARLGEDLRRCAGADVEVRLLTLEQAALEQGFVYEGECLDGLDIEVEGFGYQPGILEPGHGPALSETLYSHLLRSRCPVTGQPDWATVVVRYRGARLDREMLLRYLIGLRDHQGFHEQVIERIFVDVRARCGVDALTVYGRFTRRGGLDINPFRSDFESPPASLRTIRQ